MLVIKTMNLEEAKIFLSKVGVPGAIFPCDDPRTFNFDRELGRAKGFLEGYEAGKDSAVDVIVKSLKEYQDAHDYAEKQGVKGVHDWAISTLRALLVNFASEKES